MLETRYPFSLTLKTLELQPKNPSEFLSSL